MDDDDLERWRDEFPILSRSVYMINNSLGAMPRQTARNLAAYADAWATRGVRAWEDRWWEMPAEVGNRIARIIGAASGSVSMHENVTTAHLVALSCLRPSDIRRRIVCTAMDFPSMVYLFRGQEANGFELRVVPAEDDLTIRADRMLHTIDETTAVVAFSHVLFRTSYIMDAAAIAARAHEVGAAVILDTYQSAGIIPVDVAELGVDRIRAKSKALTARLLARIDECGFTSAAARDPQRLAGTVAVNVPDAALVASTLKAREFIVDYRPPVGVRISPHFYNTIDEVDTIMAEIESIVATKDYDAGGHRSLVT